MKPLMEGKTWDKPAAYSQIYPCANKIVLPWPDCNGNAACNHWAMRENDGDDQWRYIIYNDGSEELYNRKDDPNEQKNIVETHSDKAATMKAKLIKDLGIDGDTLGAFGDPDVAD